MVKAFVLLTVAVSSALAQFVCPDMFGMFRHPNNCSVFYVCNYGMAHERACPPHLHFDTDLGICRHPSDVHCSQPMQLLTAGFTCTSSVGLFADPFSCEHFYLCANGQPYHQKCPYGLIFDGTVCNWKYDRSCLFKNSLWLGETVESVLSEQPKDPRRPSKIDIKKIYRTTTHKTAIDSDSFSTSDKLKNTYNLTADKSRGSTRRKTEETTSQKAKATTDIPVENESVSTINQGVVSTLESNNGHNSSSFYYLQEATVSNLLPTKERSFQRHRTRSPKVEESWKVLRHKQEQYRRQQMMMQRQRQWRLQYRWRLQQQWRLQQEKQKLRERQRKSEKQQRDEEKNEQENGALTSNKTTASSWLMAGKIIIEPRLISEGPVNAEKSGRRWWRTSWTERQPHSESNTYPFLFPIRHKAQPPIVAIQAFDGRKPSYNSKSITRYITSIKPNNHSKNIDNENTTKISGKFNKTRTTQNNNIHRTYNNSIDINNEQNFVNNSNNNTNSSFRENYLKPNNNQNENNIITTDKDSINFNAFGNKQTSSSPLNNTSTANLKSTDKKSRVTGQPFNNETLAVFVTASKKPDENIDTSTVTVKKEISMDSN